jgi:hypothetical protein
MRVGTRMSAVAIAVAVAVVCVARPSCAADERNPRARAAALQAAVQEWCKTREALVVDCPACMGKGYNAKFVECPTCKAKKLYVGVAQWQALRYDVFSPAKRAKLRLTDVKAARDAEDPVRVRMKDCRYDRVELVGDFFGRAWVFEDKAEVSKESRWIEVLDVAAKKMRWFLWSEDADGPWPGEAAGAPPAASIGSSVSEPLKPDELLLVRGKVALVETKLSLEDAVREGSALVMVFSHTQAVDGTALELDTNASVVALTTAGLDAMKDVPAVRLVVLAKWRDKFGEVRKRPYRTIEISRETYGRIRFDRLSREEQLSHFTILSPKYEGEILWWKE